MGTTHLRSERNLNGETTVFETATDLDALTARAQQLRQAGDAAGAADMFAQLARRLPNEWLAQFNSGATLLEANRLDAAASAFDRATVLEPAVITFRMLAHTLALLGNMTASRVAYERAVALDPGDFDANWGLFEVCQLLGDNEAAVRHQRIALKRRSLVSVPARRAPAQYTILELCIAGTFQANIPLDFILDLQRVTVHKLYLDDHPIPALPPYDFVFNTIADAPNAGPALDAAARFIAAQDRPALNAPERVPLTSRDSIWERFSASRNVAVAATLRATRSDALDRHPAHPFLIRPLDSHAGNDLAKIDDTDGLRAYLAATTHVDDFYLSEFVDYRNADGFFRKYRIVFVDGIAYPVHMAVSPRWMIHYYNAPMAENAWMRDEEHAFMRDMGAIFSGTLADALREIAAAIPLDYFGIDCSIAPDGRLLLFEASTAMIVHMRDPVDLYPYKAEFVPRVIRALERLFDKRLGREAKS